VLKQAIEAGVDGCPAELGLSAELSGTSEAVAERGVGKEAVDGERPGANVTRGSQQGFALMGNPFTADGKISGNHRDTGSHGLDQFEGAAPLDGIALGIGERNGGKFKAGQDAGDLVMTNG
jgi:hypothetical protein